MKRKMNLCCMLFIIFAIFGSVTMTVAGEKDTGVLIVVISGFQSSNGYAMVALSDSRKNYEGASAQAFAKEKSEVENATARVVFKELPYGEYGISLYHDRNSNGKLDENAMGIPKEPYAFSNNARGMFGKPDWDEVSFQINVVEKQIAISIE